MQLLTVFGEVDVATAPVLELELRALRDARPGVLDLCSTKFMDSSGLAVLLDAARRYTGSPLHVACRPAGPVSR